MEPGPPAKLNHLSSCLFLPQGLLRRLPFLLPVRKAIQGRRAVSALRGEICGVFSVRWDFVINETRGSGLGIRRGLSYQSGMKSAWLPLLSLLSFGAGLGAVCRGAGAGRQWTAGERREATGPVPGGALNPAMSGGQNLIFEALTRQKPERVAEWLEKAPLGEQIGSRAARFAANWASEEPVAAAAWVSHLPVGDLAENAAANVARQYAEYAPAAARAWVESLPAGPVREGARKAINK